MSLVERTDQARRDFETHPVALAAVADGLSVERYRKLLLELYQIVWHFNPICAAAASRVPDAHRELRYFLYGTWPRSPATSSGSATTWRPSASAQPTLLQHRPSPSTLALIGYNYWAADRRDPCSVLGMMYVARGDRLGVRRRVRLGGARVAASGRRSRRVVHRLARHPGRGAHGAAAQDSRHDRGCRTPAKPSSNRRSSTSNS